MALVKFRLKMDHNSMKLSQMGSSMARAASYPKKNLIMKVKLGIIWSKERYLCSDKEKYRYNREWMNDLPKG